MKCPVCGTEFTPRRPKQKYCCYECQRYANRHGANDIRPLPSPFAPVIREFQCLKCGTVVRVTDPSDGRMKFCSQHCEKLYWKHSKKVKAQSVHREFFCRLCGKKVEVTDPLDRRRVFCSKECQKKWTGLSAKRKQEILEAAQQKT